MDYGDCYRGFYRGYYLLSTREQSVTRISGETALLES